jgi:hypothetical protein
METRLDFVIPQMHEWRGEGDLGRSSSPSHLKDETYNFSQLEEILSKKTIGKQTSLARRQYNSHSG